MSFLKGLKEQLSNGSPHITISDYTKHFQRKEQLGNESPHIIIPDYTKHTLRRLDINLQFIFLYFVFSP